MKAQRAIGVFVVLLMLVAPAQAATTDPYAAVHSALASAIKARLIAPDGGVYSYVLSGSQESGTVAGTGHEKTSESTGLLMAHAAAVRDWRLFATASSFYSRHLRAPVGLAYWKIDARGRPARNDDGSYSSAPIDELRIAKVFALSGVSGGPATAVAQGRPLLGAVRDGLLTDDVSWGPWQPSPGRVVQTNYIDWRAMRRLQSSIPEWGVPTVASLRVLKGAVPSSGISRTQYARGVYSCYGGTCETAPGLWIALHLLDAGERNLAYRVYSFSMRAIGRYGTLADAYSASGVPSANEDLAAYALLARLAWRLGYPSAARRIVDRNIMPNRIARGTCAGLFSYVSNDAPGFDNLEILLTFDEIAGHRPLGD